MSPTTDYERGLAAGREERADEVRMLKEALDKALAENLAARPKPPTLK